MRGSNLGSFHVETSIVNQEPRKIAFFIIVVLAVVLCGSPNLRCLPLGTLLVEQGAIEVEFYDQNCLKSQAKK